MWIPHNESLPQGFYTAIHFWFAIAEIWYEIHASEKTGTIGVFSSPPTGTDTDNSPNCATPNESCDVRRAPRFE